ncbi:MAG: Type III effector NopBP [Xanthobacteraceae bacterium]|nr:MAG: Type III effector NopBP [Xanthobacteraceae bacterium]
MPKGELAFLQRRHGRPALRTLLAPGRQQAQLSRIDERGPAAGIRLRGDVAAEHGGIGLRGAAERYMGPLDVLARGDVHHGDVQRCACAGGAVGHRVRVGAGERDEVLHRLVRAVGADRRAEAVAGDVDHVAEVGQRVEGHPRHVRQAEHGDRHLRQRVAVGPGAGGHLRRAERAAGAGLVLDDDALAEMGLRRFRQGAEAHVCRAARRPRHDQRHRPAGKACLRQTRRGEAGKGQRRRGRDEAASGWRPERLGHASSSWSGGPCALLWRSWHPGVSTRFE